MRALDTQQIKLINHLLLDYRFATTHGCWQRPSQTCNKGEFIKTINGSLYLIDHSSFLDTTKPVVDITP